jgi:hypothetical protein
MQQLFKNAKDIAMKKLSVAALVFGFVFIASCTREKDPEIRGLLGKWMLDKTIEQEWHPLDSLIYDDQYIGLAGDSVVFKANGILVQYMDGDTEPEETEYKIINDSTIRIEFETYKIRELTTNSFYLHEEDVDQALQERWIYQIYLKR